MGCGASAAGTGGGRVITKKSGKKYKEEAPPVEEAPPPPEIGKTKETVWHRKHCTDADLSIAHSINEAYPFDDSERKDVEKKEKVWNPASDGKHHDWGTVSVAKLQKKITCAGCKNLILDRYEEAPFHFCIRCKTQGGRHLELCVGCYNAGVLATGSRKKTSLLKHQDSFAGKKVATEPSLRSSRTFNQEDNMYQQNKNNSHLNPHRQESEPAMTRGASKQSRSSNGSNRSEVHSPQLHRQNSSGFGKPHSDVPCGSWKGKVTEGASGRPVIYKLFFDQSGDVSGTGPDNCEVKGYLTDMGVYQKLKWTEKHSWGNVQLAGDVVQEPPPVHIKGTFKASDGGGGKLDLTPA